LPGLLRSYLDLENSGGGQANREGANRFSAGCRNWFSCTYIKKPLVQRAFNVKTVEITIS
jgi:hypothetical protein